jgi:ribosomal 50S subunit-associated protein YjgA (DUF615 family)
MQMAMRVRHLARKTEKDRMPNKPPHSRGA